MGRVNNMLPEDVRAKDFLGKATNVTKHSGRVSGITAMLEHGVSTAEVAGVTKHRSLESVQTYNRASTSKLAEAQMTLGAILKTNDDVVEEYNSSGAEESNSSDESVLYTKTRLPSGFEVQLDSSDSEAGNKSNKKSHKRESINAAIPPQVVINISNSYPVDGAKGSKKRSKHSHKKKKISKRAH